MEMYAPTFTSPSDSTNKMAQFPAFRSSSFAQRQFEVPIQNEDIDIISPSSSSQGFPQHILQTQLPQNSQICTGEAATSRRGFLGNVFGSRSRRNTATGPDLKTEDDNNPKAPKRRGPKPDSKPAQNRRQELNRQAQRTHRERKEWYLKELEVQVQTLKENVASMQGEKRAIEKAKRAVENEKRAIENENRLLRQLLQANNIPFVGSTHMNFSQPSNMGGMAPGNIYSDSNSSVYNSYFDSNDAYKNNLTPGSQSMTLGPSPASTSTSMNHTPSLRDSISAGPNSSYSRGNASAFKDFTSPPIANGAGAVPVQSNSTDPNLYFDGSGTVDGAESSSDLTTSNPNKLVPQPFFDKPDDPLFIEFVVDLEENCHDHVGFMYPRLGDSTTEDVSGHALMFTAPTMKQIQQMPSHSVHFETKAPAHANADLNSLLARSQAYNRNNEVTPIMAALMIARDPRFPSLTVVAFKKLQATLKSRSRCYGFGAILEAYEITQAMDEACADSSATTPDST